MKYEKQCRDAIYCIPEGGYHNFEKIDGVWACMKCGCTVPDASPKKSIDEKLKQEERYATSARAEKKEEKEKKEKEEKEKKEKEEEEEEKKERKEAKRKIREAKQNECTIM